MLKTVAVFALAWVTIISAMATEEPTYTLVKKDGKIELRDYEPVMVAAVEMTNSEDRNNQPFWLLFQYISRNNAAQQEIPMTAPVTRQQMQNVEIPMTAPVTQQRQADGSWVMEFYMPADFTPETTPIPLDERVKIYQQPAQQRLIYRYSGRSNEQKVAAAITKLQAYIAANNLKVQEPHITAGYNAPMVPGFLRRNEVMYVLTD